MATKAKTKKPARKKKPAKKAASRKRSKPKQPAITVPNHPFAAGSTVGFHPRSAVEVEKGTGRKPIPAPVATAKVAKDGTLKVAGLGPGAWTAAAEVGGLWRYFDFAVKES